MRDHVILCGLGRVGARVLNHLQAANIPVVAIDTKIDPQDALPHPSTQFIKGDFRKRELLDAANLAEARGVVILTSDDLVNLAAMMTVLQMRPELRVVVRMFNPSLVARLGTVTRNVFALSTSALTAPMIALIARTGGALGAFSVDAKQPMLVTDWTVPEGHAGVGRPLGELPPKIAAKIVAHDRGGGVRRFFTDIDLEQPLRPADRLILCGPADAMRELTGDDEQQSSGFLRWSALRRQFRMIRRVAQEIDRPVKICAMVLFVVIAVSVLIFRFGVKDDGLVEAFYRTISLMATGADMRGDEFDRDAWQKGFISLLRLVGALLTAAFTAILTNYLVRAHLGGALEVRRIPDSGHVVLVGLGNIGFRVLEELVKLGERIVAIERDRDNPFIATARRLGAAVIIGDATVPEVLRQAHAAEALSILAVTQNELTNLEIGLLVREMHPKKRVVVRLADTQLAQLLREAANIRLALSIPELAAPAFIGALAGDQMRTVLVVEGRQFAVVDLVIGSADPLIGRPVAEVAAEHRLLPIALKVGAGVQFEGLAAAPLEAGCALTAIIAFRDLQLLFQRRRSV